MTDRPLYSIGTVAEQLDVHPETLRVWERHQILKPARRRGQRCYTDADLQRLLFIRHLIDQLGLNLSGVQAYVRLYPCWWNDSCPSLRCTASSVPHAKPCWRQPRANCASPLLGSEPCRSCSGTPPADIASIDAAFVIPVDGFTAGNPDPLRRELPAKDAVLHKGNSRPLLKARGVPGA